ncbi:DMT family transporter [Aetokthonos hydrillicola Thurmond2011]|uniref:DMT family transporter n=1 Tax=Aetokthonos hydrillicola Thurmond2011 TaxID=2712845 RepID=A0AAP5M9N9_9CYAN|nr:DMT family transporter [Aetokthonos hydrillicola]MBO3461658.1 DMT family transporter [Aetokthonos hydrillicola CCALA 1050]MBW4588729.1 DMT family transporter [Aetokthonos hydrillicola CCALA 1050]MDR9895937.1 DMT family transporter [Aetokthonos hydrillicola Thurmond2011]
MPFKESLPFSKRSFIPLLIALIALSFAAIFIKLSEQEIGLIGAIAMIPFVWLTEEHFFPHSLHGWLIILGLAIICQCFGQCILVHNLNKFSSGFIAVFLLLEPTLTAIFAWLIFAETLSALNLLAFVIVLIGIFFAKTSQSSNSKTLQEGGSR